MKEWRSKKELDDFIFEKNRNEEIGYVYRKTLNKWGIEFRFDIPDDPLYFYQKGDKFFIFYKRKKSE